MSESFGLSRLGTLLLGAGMILTPEVLLNTATAGLQPSERAVPVYVGVTLGPVDPVVHRHLPATRGAGLTVQTVTANSPAARSGLRQHDILLRWEDQWLFHASQLRGLLDTLEPGQGYACTILRQGIEEQMELVLSARTRAAAPGPEVRLASVPFAGWQDGSTLGLHLTEILQAEPQVDDEPADTLIYQPEQLLGLQWRPASDTLLAQLGQANRSAVVIDAVQEDSPAGRAGLKSMDLLFELQGGDILSPEQFTERLYRVPQGSLLSFGVWRGGESTNIQVSLPAPARRDTARGASPVPPVPSDVTDDWIHGLGTTTEWIILLKSPTDSSPGMATASPLSASSADLPGTASGLNVFELSHGQGSIEVQERGGQQRYIVRDAQGSLRYEGPIDTENLEALRPLPPGMRRAVEDFATSPPTPAPPVEVRRWRWRPPTAHF
jgi:hypothetical protein